MSGEIDVAGNASHSILSGRVLGSAIPPSEGNPHREGSPGGPAGAAADPRQGGRRPGQAGRAAAGLANGRVRAVSGGGHQDLPPDVPGDVLNLWLQTLTETE